ncbi:MAG: FAD/NAD(P)-binding protein [Desulfovibrio sp.]|nr:FAD/NAD(P)-binding protein [Desulfovibrio sp.]
MQQGLPARPLINGNPYLPMPARVIEVIRETNQIKTLRVILEDDDAMERFHFEPGQVAQLSVFGVGEATFVINSPPSQKDYLQFSIMEVGEVTRALHKLTPGEVLGVRAPLGNFFPYNDWLGKNLYFIGGGIGMAPVRTIMLHVLERASDYGDISLLFGARTPKDMSYQYELPQWLSHKDLHCTLCVDKADANWPHKEGMVPQVLKALAPSPKNSLAILCGPPIMIKYTVETLLELGFAENDIFTTLERRMKCGIGICGRCNIGSRYVCTDGPVFTCQQVRKYL